MHLTELMDNVPSTTEAALELFDSAPAVETDAMIGTWRGAELPTNHPMDGLLAASGWWGKQFVDAETVHPLLFPTPDGQALWPMNPAFAFSGVPLAAKAPSIKSMSFGTPIAATRLLWRARSAKARLRTTRYRGVDTATMLYDQLPINDVFRRLADDAVLGAMDLKGSDRPYFFALRRDNSLPVR
ncbi:DUF4334 domain-containing protein [Gordonia sp. HNM0687]|uniref:DUF4334 domain-containing protein n=1 Tax=Gordonia mangrovi TaxID=2665643 RepID=A0A6L7GYZ9_9ACTN|nr:DUF4334 domain-containing protein [Gordonia mangrovi]MXP24118.1 DUF4334 domain-containing protein [Gordonia mangrovi]UVF78080.1 DUF4334 domain-containing protein [Gordonia mangrovi]